MEGRQRNFKYAVLSKRIEENIKEGVYQVGDKLPSIRDLQKQTQLSFITVNRAFVELEQQGLIEARPKSGYYVKAPSLVEGMPNPFQSKPTPVALSEMTNSILSQTNNPHLLPLGAAVLPPEMLPNKFFNRVLKSLNVQELESLLSYGPIEGDFELRRQIVQRSVGMAGRVTPDDLLITNGCIEAISLCLSALLKPGDTIALESPTYFLLLQLLKELRIMVVEIPSHPIYGFDVVFFEKVIKGLNIKACLLTPNFNNPMGTLMPDEQKEKLAHLAHRHRIPIIEDDIYSELYYQKSQPSTVKSFDHHDMVLSCSSFSKTLSPGARVGWVVPGKLFYDKIRKMKGGTTISTALLNQHLLSEYLRFGSYDRHLRSLRRNLKKHTETLALQVRKHFPKGTRVMMPQGGFTLWVELPMALDSTVVFNRALEEKILIIPGIICANSGLYKNFIRLSCGHAYSEQMEKGLKTLARLIHEQL